MGLGREWGRYLLVSGRPACESGVESNGGVESVADQIDKDWRDWPDQS